MPKGTVVTEQGKKMQLAPMTEAGLEECPGEAHTNPFIDNCMICAPRWGKVMTYQPPKLEQVMEGFAVPVGRVARGARAVFEKAEAEGTIKMVGATEKYRGGQTYFNVYVKA